MTLRFGVLWLVLVTSGCAAFRPAPPPPPPKVVAVPARRPGLGSLWRPDRAGNYAFLDVRAHFPGDLLTVVISEQAEGKKDATTEASADSSIEASVDEFFGIPAAMVKFLPKAFKPEMILQAKTARSSTGDAETTRTGSLTGSITVRVIDVDPNGNLDVRGEKIVRVNSESQHIVLEGTVRPEDVRTDNSVLSSRLADARIAYYGLGTVGDKQGVPLVHRLYDWVWPF